MTIAELRPHGDRLLVRPDPKHETSEGGLVITEVVLADNPNYYTMSGVVLKLGDGVREDVYACVNHQCRYECRRTVGERCPICGAVQKLVSADSGAHAFDVRVGDRIMFGRFAGKQIEVEPDPAWDMFMASHRLPMLGHARRVLMMREIEVLGVLTGDERVMPGYEPAKWNKPTAGLTPTVTSR